MPPTEDWIQESLARLESLEEERNRHEAALETATDPAVLRMNAQAIERLDAKIRSLYAELEAAAEQGEEAEAGDEVAAEPDADEEDVGTNETTAMFHRDTLVSQAKSMKAPIGAPAQAAAPAPVQAAPVQAAAPVRAAAAVAAAAAPASNPVAAPVSSPFGGAPASTPTASPFGGAPAASPFGGAPSPTPAASPFGGGAPAAPFTGSSSGEASPFGEVPVGSAPAGFSSSPMSSNSFDAGNSFDEESSGGGGAKWGIIVGVVLVLGIGGYFAFGGKKEEPVVTEPTGPAKVLKAGEVPPDTQGPKTVKGSHVDAIKGTQFKEGRPNSGGGSHSGGGSNNSAPASDKGKKKDPRAKIESTDDPLAGIDK